MIFSPPASIHGIQAPATTDHIKQRDFRADDLTTYDRCFSHLHCRIPIFMTNIRGNLLDQDFTNIVNLGTCTMVHRSIFLLPSRYHSGAIQRSLADRQFLNSYQRDTVLARGAL